MKSSVCFPPVESDAVSSVEKSADFKHPTVQQAHTPTRDQGSTSRNSPLPFLEIFKKMRAAAGLTDGQGKLRTNTCWDSAFGTAHIINLQALTS